MLGISMQRSALVLVASALSFGCVKSVNQAAHTGKDGKYKGARAIELDPADNTGETKGIVTYPGGDRVDWKMVTIPEGKKGTLSFDLSWKPPRPGLDLAFDVYDQYGQKIGSVKPKKPAAAKKSKKKRGKKSVSVGPAAGVVYVQIYASNRGDAGAYRMNVKFEEQLTEAAPVFDPGLVSIPQPPKLAAVPPPCDPAAIDPKNPECKGVSPPCDPKTPDPANPNCKGVTKACDPNALDPLNPACLAYYPECDPLAIDAKNPKCKGVTKPPPEPINADIVATENSGTGTVITINVGTKEGVDTKWTGKIVDSSGNAIQGSSFTIFKAKDHSCFAKVKIGKATVDKNLAVRLTPP
jgi:hypothetical protein